MVAALLTLFSMMLLVVLIGVAWRLAVWRTRSRYVELNRQSLEVYRAARRVHAQAVSAFDELLTEARRNAKRGEERPG